MPRGIYPRKKKAELRAAKKPSAKKAALVEKVLHAQKDLLAAHKENVTKALDRFEEAVRNHEMSGGGDPAFFAYNEAEMVAARAFLDSVLAAFYRDVQS